MNHLNIKQIEEILPHRHPFLLVDYIEDYEPENLLLAINVSHSGRIFLKDIFPRSR